MMARANRYKRPKEVMKVQKRPLGSNAQGPIWLEGVSFLSYYNLVCRCAVVVCDAYDVYSVGGSGELQRGAVGVVSSYERSGSVVNGNVCIIGRRERDADAVVGSKTLHLLSGLYCVDSC